MAREKSPTTEDVVKGMIDPDILNMLTSGIKSALSEKDKTHRNDICELAANSVRCALDSFPEYAKEYVYDIFNERMNEAQRFGRNNSMVMHYGQFKEAEIPPKITDLLAPRKD